MREPTSILAVLYAVYFLLLNTGRVVMPGVAYGRFFSLNVDVRIFLSTVKKLKFNNIV